MFGQLAEDDALRKARGEPTQNFHDVQPNYNNAEVKAARDEGRAPARFSGTQTNRPTVSRGSKKTTRVTSGRASVTQGARGSGKKFST